MTIYIMGFHATTKAYFQSIYYNMRKWLHGVLVVKKKRQIMYKHDFIESYVYQNTNIYRTI